MIFDSKNTVLAFLQLCAGYLAFLATVAVLWVNEAIIVWLGIDASTLAAVVSYGRCFCCWVGGRSMAPRAPARRRNGQPLSFGLYLNEPGYGISPPQGQTFGGYYNTSHQPEAPFTAGVGSAGMDGVPERSNRMERTTAAPAAVSQAGWALGLLCGSSSYSLRAYEFQEMGQ